MNGRRNRSTTGDQTNLSVYTSDTQDSMPMVARLMPLCRSHADSVLKISMNGRPLENPRASIDSMRGRA